MSDRDTLLAAVAEALHLADVHPHDDPTVSLTSVGDDAPVHLALGGAELDSMTVILVAVIVEERFACIIDERPLLVASSDSWGGFLHSIEQQLPVLPDAHVNQRCEEATSR